MRDMLLRVRIFLIFALALVLSAATNAQKSVSWTPEHLSSGSPCLFTVEFASPAVTVEAKWLDQEVEFFPSASKTTWYALAGADVETAPGTYPLTLHATLASGKQLDATRDIEIGPSSYRQVTLSVEQKFTEPDAATLARIAADKQLKDHIFAHSAPKPLWHGDFLRPVTAPATDSFGTRRVFNGKLASIHRGMDFRAHMGTPVYSANSGKVVLARPMFFEGNCVILDHGQGIWTIYMHLSKIRVTEGETVTQHQFLGLSGATGRATGPHLHMSVRWRNASLDPAILFRMKLPATE